MPFTQVLHLLAAQLHLPSLAPDPDGSCALQVGEVAVALLPHDEREGFALRCRIGNVAHEGHVAAMEALMAANLFEDGPASSVLGMDPGGDIYLLQHFRHAHFAAGPFMAAFERFIDRAHRWQAKLAQAAQDHAQPPQAAGEVRA